MHDRGMSYKGITKLLNEKNITTHKGKKWGVYWKLCLFSADEIPTKIKTIRISIQRIRTAMVKNGSQMEEKLIFKKYLILQYHYYIDFML